MAQKRIKIYSLATTYPESIYSKKPKFVHLLNSELVKLGMDVKTITLHSKGASTNEINGLLVSQKDPTSIARAIERLILDKELARKIVENSKTTVRQFSPRSIAQEYLVIFKNIVNK